MNACHGPCEQGKKKCPCPTACEVEDSLDFIPSTWDAWVKFIGIALVCGLAAASVLNP
jgi:hypothetical protein